VQILMLDTGDPVRPGFTELIGQYARQVQDRLNRPVQLSIEHFPDAQLADSAFVVQLLGWVGTRYEIEGFEAVVVIGLPNVRTLRLIRAAIPTRTPIICYTRGPQAMEIAEAAGSVPNSFPVTNGEWIGDGIALIWKVRPATTGVIGIANSDVEGRRLEQLLREHSPPDRPVEVMVRPTVEDVIQKADASARSTAIFFANVSTDRTGRSMPSANFVEAFAPNIKQPVFVTELTQLRPGVLGGLLASTQARAEALASRTADAIVGAISDEAPPLVIKTTRSTWREGSMLDFGIRRRDLPPASDVVSWEPSVWERYPRGSALVTALGVLLLAATLALAVERRRLVRSNASLRQREGLIVRALSGIAETRDGTTGRHLKRTQEYVRALARATRSRAPFANQITKEFLEHLHLSAPLHDIGKVGVPDEILRKAGPLTPDEVTIMRTHTVIGEQVLRAAKLESGGDVPFLELAMILARSHHEWWDGTGYPDGLAGADIPLAARLLAIADVYDALRTSRSYKPALEHEDVVRMICERDGTHFDPALVPVFLTVHEEFRRVSETLSDQPA
jgi:HD-GYP domain-containing protein (c-di-GMP phosphodiesterase class II)